MEWDVVDVKTIAPLALRVQFADGTVGKVQFEQSHLTGDLPLCATRSFFSKRTYPMAPWRGPATWIWRPTRCTWRSKPKANGFCGDFSRLPKRKLMDCRRRLAICCWRGAAALKGAV